MTVVSESTGARTGPIQPRSQWQSEKIQATHWERLAVVYVRQSTPQQVLNHQESTRMQYNLKERAIQLGWVSERVLTIDDDQGKSGASAEGRTGFQRLVSEVTLGHVGLILGLEMSRLARSCKDWHQLLEVCGLFGTLIADLDGVYDPAHFNDRLLLGLKGTMSEAELHILKQRMLQGRLNKAGRGELAFAVPNGYIRRPSGEVSLDPDEQVQSVVRLVFRKFEELGTLHAVLRFLVAHRIQTGVRIREGSHKGELEWRHPARMTIYNILKNPMYAGAYAYGRSQQDPRRKRAGRPNTGRVRMPRDRWRVLLKDRFPAYISWDQYERNLARLRSNRARAEEARAVRGGPALLCGLLICARCGSRMTVHYQGGKTGHRYGCQRMLVEFGTKACQGLAGPPLDRFVTERVLEALEPASLELSLTAAGHMEQEREALLQVWGQRLERAAYEAERASRHYRLVEPENRLVARQLAQAWEGKLLDQKELEEEHRRWEQEQPRTLTGLEQEAIRNLAQDIPALWKAPTTTDGDRKEILRQIVNRIVVDSQGQSERVGVTIEWIGGTKSTGQVIKPVRKLEQLTCFAALRERLDALVAQDLTVKAIAQRLNQEGFRSPKRGTSYTEVNMRTMIRRLGLREPQKYTLRRSSLEVHEWWLPDLARAIPMPSATLYSWLRRGWVKGHKEKRTQGRWIVRADAAELERLQHLHQLPLGFHSRAIWAEDKPLKPQKTTVEAVG